MRTTVLCLPGVGCGPQVFRFIEQFLKREDFIVETLTFPGKGEGQCADGLSIDDYVEFASEKIASTLGPVILIGHSLGGKIARLAAAKNPTQVQAIFLIDSVPQDGVFLGLRLLLRMFRPRYLWAMITGKAVRFSEADLRSVMLNGMSFPATEAQSFVAESGRVLRECALGMFKFWKKEPELPKSCLVFLIVSEFDRTIPPRAQHALGHALNVPFFVTVLGASHMFLSDEKQLGSIPSFISSLIQLDVARNNEKFAVAAE